MSWSLGRGLRSSNAFAAMTMPLPQKPHWQACSAMNARCSGWSFSREPSPSIVVIRLFAALETAVEQDRARPALGQAAAVLGTVQLEIVAQNVEQRGVRLHADGLRLAVHPQ